MLSSCLSPKKMLWLKFTLLISMLFLMGSCQKKPTLGSAADPLSESEPPPMGATVYNDELKREIVLLDDVLEQRVDNKKLTALKKALMHGEPEAFPKDANSAEAHLAKLLLTLPELIHETSFSDVRKKWMKGKLYFLRRRFIEASTLMTDVLKAEPNFYEARNLRARAIFFLGNPDLATKELNAIIQASGEKSSQGLDALYLIGAITFESNELDNKRLSAGIEAWNKYLKLANANEQMNKEITEGLAELRMRKEGKRPADEKNALDPFAPSDQYSSEKNAILKAFAKEELLLAKELSEHALKKTFDLDIATVKARILFKMGQHDDALQMFNAITSKNKKYAPGFHYQGMVFMLQGKPKDAVSSWKQAQEANPVYAKSFRLDERIAVAEKLIQPKKIETH